MCIFLPKKNANAIIIYSKNGYVLLRMALVIGKQHIKKAEITHVLNK